MVSLMQKTFKFNKRTFMIIPKISRSKGSLGLWNEELNTDIKISIERHWQDYVQNKRRKNMCSNSMYVLPMFPYPSGNLHMGHVRVYSISDTISRLYSLLGSNVIHPMGWDAFGLPAENAAIEHKIPPDIWTTSNIASMKNQLEKLAFGFDWSREISTCSPDYYKWTQYIFLKLYENGLVYQNMAKVNWDPVDKTVLADEQVDEFGCSWRSGAKVEKKILKQWFVKTTSYAKYLYDGLDNEHIMENWGDIVNLQRHWIGECNGVTVKFTVDIGNERKVVELWTSQPHKFIHGQFIAIKTDSQLNQDIKEMGLDNCSTIWALNPLNGRKLSLYATDQANYAEGQDYYIASPSTDEDDENLAISLGIKNIPKCNVDKENDGQEAIKLAKSKNVGGYFVNSKLKDWLISRQRYWGTPIPIIHCGNCGAVPVSYDDLPVKLPSVKSFKTGIQTLANEEDWINCKCHKCGAPSKRETDTMDTFVDSSWYYYRFLDPHNEKKPFDKTKLIGNAPVNIYVGGKEHAVLHLYYARFMSYFLHKLGWTPSPEPFQKLIVQGMVMGESFKLKSSGKYILPETVYKDGTQYKEKGTNEPVLVQWEKMSKSKYNGENPENLLTKYGCDTTRLFILADVPPSISRKWSDATFPGVLNWQRRLWYTMRDFLKHRNDSSIDVNLISKDDFESHEKKLVQALNVFTSNTTYAFKHSNMISVGISRLQTLTSSLRSNVPPSVIAKSRHFERALASLIIMIAPLAPHFSSELWAGLQSAPNRLCEDEFQYEKGVLQQTWPEVDDDFGLPFRCKVDGQETCTEKFTKQKLLELTEESAMQLAMKHRSTQNRTKRGISKIKFANYPNCIAVLEIITNTPTQLPEGKLKKKLTAK